MTTDAAQGSLATKVQHFLAELTREEAALFTASIAGGIVPGEGVEGETIDVQGFGLLPLAPIANSAVASPTTPRVEPLCRWQADGPGTLCYYCGTVRVKCVNFG